MIVLLVISIGLYITAIFHYYNSDYFTIAQYRAFPEYLMLLFLIVALYYSFTLGTPLKLIIISVVGPFAYYIIRSFPNRLTIVRNFNDAQFSDFRNYIWIGSLIIAALVYYFNYKYSKSNIFLVLLFFVFINMVIAFGNIMGAPMGSILKISLIRIPKSVLLILAIIYEQQISNKLSKLRQKKTPIN